MRRDGRTRRWAPLVWTSAGLLLWGNLVVPALPPVPGQRAAANLTAAVALALAARRGGLSWADLGLDRRNWRAGMRWGAGAGAVVTAAYGVILAVPGLRPLLVDPRVATATTGEVVLRALVLIPLGTVLSEELGFRGVLQGLASRVLPPGRALAVTSAVFGLWHIATARSPAGGTPPAQVLAVAGVVVVTGAGGLVFGWLRRRGGSLLAPLGAHLATNGVGLLAARVASILS